MLREQLGRREGLDADHVLLFAGAAELIDLTVRTFVGPGEEVLISAPAPVLFELRTRAVGGIPVPLPAADECEIDVPALIAAVTERTKLVFLCTPTNPTGNRAEEAAIRRVLRLGLPTAVDEAYHDVDERGSSLAYLLHEFPNTIFLRTFSKAFGLAGMRLAYTLAHPAVTRLLARVKVPSTVPGLAIAAASAALDGAQEQPAPARELGQGLA
jgi:histidinol-phosphate aminotransferase